MLNPEALLEAAHAARRRLTPEAGPTPHILVIDDSLTSRVLLQNILEAGGFKVDLAVSGEDAMAKARARHYSLFLCDVEMPGMNGFEFVARTREYDYLLRHSFDSGHHPRRRRRSQARRRGRRARIHRQGRVQQGLDARNRSGLVG